MRVELLALLTWFAVGCGGPDPEETRLSRSIEQLRTRRDGLRAELKARQDVAALAQKRGLLALAVVTPQDLQAAYGRVLPLHIDARSITEYATGTIIVERLEQVSIDGHNVQFVAHGKGRDIKVNVTPPPPYDRMAREIVDGLHAGLELRIRGELHMEDGKPRMRFVGRCESAKLRRHAKDDYHAMIRDGINGQVLNRPHGIDLPPHRIGRADWKAKGMIPSRGRLVFVVGR